MTTISPAPFPENGQRKLSPKEQLQRAKALACTLPKDKMPTSSGQFRPVPASSGQVYVGMFFDGTGNNRDKDSVEPPLEVTQYAKALP